MTTIYDRAVEELDRLATRYDALSKNAEDERTAVRYKGRSVGVREALVVVKSYFGDPEVTMHCRCRYTSDGTRVQAYGPCPAHPLDGES